MERAAKVCCYNYIYYTKDYIYMYIYISCILLHFLVLGAAVFSP